MTFRKLYTRTYTIRVVQYSWTRNPFPRQSVINIELLAIWLGTRRFRIMKRTCCYKLIWYSLISRHLFLLDYSSFHSSRRQNSVFVLVRYTHSTALVTILIVSKTTWTTPPLNRRYIPRTHRISNNNSIMDTSTRHVRVR